MPSLRFLFDEIFGAPNRIGTIVWENATDNNPTNIAIEHEYVLCYAKNKSSSGIEWKSVNMAVKARLLKSARDFVGDFPDQRKRQDANTRSGFARIEVNCGHSKIISLLIRMVDYIRECAAFTIPARRDIVMT